MSGNAKMMASAVACMAFIGSFSASADEAKMNVVAQNGTSQAFTMNGLRKVVLGNDGFTVISRGGEEKAFQYADVRKIDFVLSGELGLSEVTVSKLAVYLDARNLYVGGWSDGAADVALYNMGGQMCRSVQGWDGEPIDVAGLPAGVYILKLKQSTIKFILR